MTTTTSMTLSVEHPLFECGDFDVVVVPARNPATAAATNDAAEPRCSFGLRLIRLISNDSSCTILRKSDAAIRIFLMIIVKPYGILLIFSAVPSEIVIIAFTSVTL